MEQTSHLTIVWHDGKKNSDPNRGFSFIRNGSDNVTNQSKPYKTRQLLLDAWANNELSWKYKTHA